MFIGYSTFLINIYLGSLVFQLGIFVLNTDCNSFILWYLKRNLVNPVSHEVTLYLHLRFHGRTMVIDSFCVPAHISVPIHLSSVSPLELMKVLGMEDSAGLLLPAVASGYTVCTVTPVPYEVP